MKKWQMLQTRHTKTQRKPGIGAWALWQRHYNTLEAHVCCTKLNRESGLLLYMIDPRDRPYNIQLDRVSVRKPSSSKHPEERATMAFSACTVSTYTWIGGRLCHPSEPHLEKPLHLPWRCTTHIYLRLHSLPTKHGACVNTCVWWKWVWQCPLRVRGWKDSAVCRRHALLSSNNAGLR